jgi:hypothetical protein
MDGSELGENRAKVAEFFELLEKWETEERWRVFSMVRRAANWRRSGLACLGARGRMEMDKRKWVGLFGGGVGRSSKMS